MPPRNATAEPTEDVTAKSPLPQRIAEAKSILEGIESRLGIRVAARPLIRQQNGDAVCQWIEAEVVLVNIGGG